MLKWTKHQQHLQHLQDLQNAAHTHANSPTSSTNSAAHSKPIRKRYTTGSSYANQHKMPTMTHTLERRLHRRSLDNHLDTVINERQRGRARHSLTGNHNKENFGVHFMRSSFGNTSLTALHDLSNGKSPHRSTDHTPSPLALNIKRLNTAAVTSNEMTTATNGELRSRFSDEFAEENDVTPLSRLKFRNKLPEESLSSSRMGDVTLDRMLDAIIESARKEVKPKCKHKRLEEHAKENMTPTEEDSIHEMEVRTPQHLKRQKVVRRKNPKNTEKKNKQGKPEDLIKSTEKEKTKSQKQMKEMIGLTLPNGIPSPDTPLFKNSQTYKALLNMETPPQHLTFEVQNDMQRCSTPSLEQIPSIKRCLSFSCNSEDEEEDYQHCHKRSSVASSIASYTQEQLSGSSTSLTAHAVKGSLDVAIYRDHNQLNVHVIRCRDLQLSNGSTNLNAYVKVNLLRKTETEAHRFQRTAVHSHSSRPYFDHCFKFDISDFTQELNELGEQDLLQMSVWHRDRQLKKSIQLGIHWLLQMFSLVKFSNDQFGVLQSKHVQKTTAKICIAKCSGGKYEALLVAKSDDKSKLLDLKNKKENCLSYNANSPSTSRFRSPVGKLRKKSTNLHSPAQETFLTSNTNSPSTSSCCSSPGKVYNKSTKFNSKVQEKLSISNDSSPSTSNFCSPLDKLSKSGFLCPIDKLRNKSTKLNLQVQERTLTSNLNAPSLLTSSTDNLHHKSPKFRSKIHKNQQVSTSEKLTNEQLEVISKEINIDIGSINKFPCNNKAISTNIVPQHGMFPLSTAINTEIDLQSEILNVNADRIANIKHTSQNSMLTFSTDLQSGNMLDIISSDTISDLKNSTTSKTTILPFSTYKGEQILLTDNDLNISSIQGDETESSNSQADTISNLKNTTKNKILPFSTCNNTEDSLQLESSIDKNNNRGNYVEILNVQTYTIPDLKNTTTSKTTILPFTTYNAETILLSDNEFSRSSIRVDKAEASNFETDTSSLKNTTKNIIYPFSTCNTEDSLQSENLNDENSSQAEIPNVQTDTISNFKNSTHFENSTLALSTSKNAENSLQSENFLDISSTRGNLSSFSEYIPDFSADMSKDTLENSKNNIADKSDCVDEIIEPLNINKVSIPYSKSSTKKHFCIYCKKLHTKISRHFFVKHKNEEEVKTAFGFPKNSKERLEIMNKIRKKGDFEHNTSAQYNTGVLIVSRRQLSKCKNTVDDYVCCKGCKAFFSKRTIRIHKRTSCGKTKGKRSNQIESHRLTQYVHPSANSILKSKIFPVFRNDEIVQSIRYDELIVKYGNYLAEKYSSSHLHDMIRAKLRLLGRFKIEIKKFYPTINELKEIYKPELFDNCIKALRIVAKWSDTTVGFKTPAVAPALTSLIKKCGMQLKLELIKQKRDDLKGDLENFLFLWDQEIALINKKALDDQSNQKRNKKIVLPSIDDIRKLYTYLKERVLNCMASLSEMFSLSNWTQLVQATLILIQIFNRRRSGEIERLTVKNFENKETITENIDKDILDKVSKDSLKFAKQFVRISLRGKLGRTVSVLLSPMCTKSLEILLKYRKQAGISSENKYIFARPTTTKLSKDYYRACPLLRMFSRECGAKFSDSLRGTILRKHIATYTSLLNIEEASVERLANFMGHHKEIHKNIYRVPIPVAEITCVSKILMAAVGDDHDVDGDSSDSSDNDTDEETSNTNEDILQQSLNSSTSSKKRRSRSPFGKTKRCRWSDPEKEAISCIFGDLSALKQLPTLNECQVAINQYEALSQRTPQQIKSWIDNQRRYKAGKII